MQNPVRIANRNLHVYVERVDHALMASHNLLGSARGAGLIRSTTFPPTTDPEKLDEYAEHWIRRDLSPDKENSKQWCSGDFVIGLKAAQGKDFSSKCRLGKELLPLELTTIKILYGTKHLAATTEAEIPKLKTKILKDSFNLLFLTMQYVQNIIRKNRKQINCRTQNSKISRVDNSIIHSLLTGQVNLCQIPHQSKSSDCIARNFSANIKSTASLQCT